jgi:hypothetical protein
MEGIAEVHGMWIGQDLGRFVEGDAVLCCVGDRLRFVPFESPYTTVGTAQP